MRAARRGLLPIGVAIAVVGLIVVKCENRARTKQRAENPKKSCPLCLTS